jgi:hypothetical protein
MRPKVKAISQRLVILKRVMDIPADINLVKAELAQLESELATASEQERIAIRNQITALINRLPNEAPAGSSFLLILILI